MQLDMFNSEEITALKEEIASLKKEVATVKKSSDQVRKGLFARHMGIEKYMIDVKDHSEMVWRELDRLRRKVYEEDMEPVQLRKVS